MVKILFREFLIDLRLTDPRHHLVIGLPCLRSYIGLILRSPVRKSSGFCEIRLPASSMNRSLATTGNPLWAAGVFIGKLGNRKVAPEKIEPQVSISVAHRNHIFHASTSHRRFHSSLFR